MDNSIYQFEETRTVKSSGKFTPIPKGPHNESVMKNAEGNAKYKRKHSSEEERKMMELLDGQNVRYEFQKIVYIKSSGGFIKQYFIVDFFIPSRDVVIEMHGVPSKETLRFAGEKRAAIKKAYPLYTMIDWFSGDFSAYNKVKNLVSLLKGQ